MLTSPKATIAALADLRSALVSAPLSIRGLSSSSISRVT